MSEPRECDEAFESEEGDGEPFLEEGDEEEEEPESSNELLERIRELEAENTALAVASENQREAYERCLDEVANHVVQALLNQKDLREECINLKMRVFDLERQNRTLTELFTQKLQASPSHSQQLPPAACLEMGSDPGRTGTQMLTPLGPEGKGKNNAECAQIGAGNSTQVSASSMESMSPFLKKKAHILEVLRKLEETDPLKFHPSTCYYYHGQALLPGETTSIVTPSPCQLHCRHSSSDSDIREYANEEGDSRASFRYGGCPSCRALSQRSSLDSLLKCNPGLREDDTYSQMFSEEHGASAQSADPQAKLLYVVKTSNPNTNSTHSQRGMTHLSQPVTKATVSYLSSMVASCSEPNTKLGEEPEKDEISTTMSKGVNDGDKDSRESESKSSKDNAGPRHEHCYVEVSARSVKSEPENLVQVCNGVFSSNETVPKKVVESHSPVPLAETAASAFTQQQAAAKSKFGQSSTSPSFCSGSKTSPVSSPSKLLKLLKIPLMAENTPTTNAFHLSPQLTRSSKIPCRNNYEVYHSSMMSHKATTTERDKPSTPSKTDTGTHSAPTSPPNPEDPCSSLSIKESSYSSHSAPKTSKVSKSVNQSSSQPLKGGTVVHYENIADPSHSKMDLPQITSGETDPKEKQKMSAKDERVISPLSLKSSDSSGSTDESSSDASDQDTDTESPVWQRPQNHFSLPTSSSAATKAQRSTYSSMKEKYHERRPPEALSAQKHDMSIPSQAVAKKSDKQPSLPKRTVSSKPQTDSSYHPFKERLAALGKLKSTEDLQQTTEKKDAQRSPGKIPASTGNNARTKTAERQGERIAMEQRPSKYTDSLDGKTYHKTSFGNYVKGHGSMNINTSTEKHYVAKPDVQKIKVGMSTASHCETVVMRSYGKCPNPLTHHSKTVPSPQGSPIRVLSKSPSKASSASSYPRGMKTNQDERSHLQRQPSRADDKPKLAAGKRKTFAHAENAPPSMSTRPGAGSAHSSAAPALQSAIEQKVMRGIEENMLKLQDRGQAAESKHKTSNGIASWFGLKKSKLPALNRKSEMSKMKLNISSSSSSSSSGAKDASGAKGGQRKVVESLNISKLMEKAEDLRKALEEERVYVNGVGIALDRPGRGHSCEVVVDQAQGQLSLMYRGVTADNFMQQLLNRVDERGAGSFGMVHRRLSFDSKRSRPVFSYQSNGITHTRSREDIDKGSDMVSRDEITSDESLAESISSQHFTGSGSSMRTLDSGIGTFPLPDCGSSGAGKGLLKPQEHQGSFASQGKHGAVLKAPRKARTLERELSSLDEVNPCDLYTSPLEAKGARLHLSSTIHEDMDAYEGHLQAPPTQLWTFPTVRGPAGDTTVYLQDVEPTHEATLSRPSKRPQGSHEADHSSLPLPPQTGGSRQGKARTHCGPAMSKEGALELVKERPDDILSPSRPQALETPECLSDSLYDSLSSCGSQG